MTFIDVVWYFAVIGSKILGIMDHVKLFMFSKGHVLAENLSTNFFQILDWPRNVHNAQKFNNFLKK